MLAAVAVAVVVVVGAITAVVVTSSNDDSSTGTVVPREVTRNGGPKAGDPAHAFTLKTLDGKTVSLADYRGKPVVLNFWASWCNPCRREFPRFRDALTAHPGTFVMLGVDYKDIASDARAFARSQHATWPMLDDSANAVSTVYGIRAIPQTFFIRRDGTISQRFYSEPQADDFTAALTEITKPSKA